MVQNLRRVQNSVPPPENCPPPEQFRGGDSQNVPPLSDSGGGQRFFSWYFLVNSFHKWCKIFPFLLNSAPPLPPLSPPWGAQGGTTNFFLRFAPDLSPLWAKSCIRPCTQLYTDTCMKWHCLAIQPICILLKSICSKIANIMENADF